MEYTIEKIGAYWLLTEKNSLSPVWAVGTTLAEAKANYYTAKYAILQVSNMSLK